jgi:hypothetical protein
MSDLPPPLAWLESFRRSTERALGDPIGLEVHGTVNPLVYAVYLKCPNSSGALRLGVWNLLQKWAIRNGCPLQGKDVSDGEGELRVQVLVQRRLGPPKNELPWA